MGKKESGKDPRNYCKKCCINYFFPGFYHYTMQGFVTGLIIFLQNDLKSLTRSNNNAGRAICLRNVRVSRKSDPLISPEGCGFLKHQHPLVLCLHIPRGVEEDLAEARVSKVKHSIE